MSEFNDRVIAEFRANAGRVDSAGFGSSLVLLHTRGAKTGAERINPLMFLPDSEGWLVVASAKGAPRDPAWAVNLRASPQAAIEVSVDGAVHTVRVHATELDGSQYDAAFARFTERAPAFATYQRRAGRRLPIIRLSPLTADLETPTACRGRSTRPPV